MLLTSLDPEFSGWQPLGINWWRQTKTGGRKGTRTTTDGSRRGLLFKSPKPVFHFETFHKLEKLW